MDEKLKAVDHLRPLMRDGATLFGATILGRGIAPNRAASALLDLYNAQGVFNNREDDLAALIGRIAATLRHCRDRARGLRRHLSRDLVAPDCSCVRVAREAAR